MEELAIADHQNYFNSQILNGYRYDAQNDNRHFFSSIIKPWSKLSGEEKGIFRNRVSTILPAISEMFGKNNGEYKSHGIFKHRFRHICGFIDNSAKKINWTAGDHANNLYQNLISQLYHFYLSTQYTNRIYKENHKHDRYKSLAVLCTLAEDGNAMFMDMALRRNIPVIALLPQKPEQFQYQFAEGRSRDYFWQRLRNVYTYYVVPEEIEDKEKYIRDFIAGYSDEIWHIGQYELSDDINAGMTVDVEYIKKCSDTPMLREIKIDGPITRETQVLFPAYYEKRRNPSGN